MSEFLVSDLFFYIFAILGVASALLVVLKNNPVASAFSLVLSFFCFAGIYVLMNAHLIAAMQVLVYAGAIMVLFVFVIMLLDDGAAAFDKAKAKPVQYAAAAGLVLCLLCFFVWAFKNSTYQSKGVFTDQAIASSGGNTQVLAELMFSSYILPFELTSILLLAAIVGSVAIAMRKTKKGAAHETR